SEIAHAVTGAGGSPFFIIDSRTQAAFRDAKDEQSDLDPTPKNPLTQDLDANNVEGEANVPGELVSVAAVSERAHRVDTLSFFASFLYRRQTGNSYPVPNNTNNPTYVAQMSSGEAWITYGHGRVYDVPNTNQIKPEDDDMNY